jgi:hypothetical protein
MDTNLDQLIEWLNSVGVTYDKEETTEKITVRIMDYHKKVASYIGFFMYFSFDKAGKFLLCGAGE